MSLHHFFTGSLVKWRRGHTSATGYGIVTHFETVSTPLQSNVQGVWVHWPGKSELMWASMDSVIPLVQSGSML